MKNKRILLLIKVPPPVTGPTLMNNRILGSELLNNNFDIRSICTSYVNNVNELGSYNFNKLITFISVFVKLFKELVFNRPSFVYFQISPLGVAFLRDFCFVIVIKLLKVKIVYHLRGKGIKEQAKIKWKRSLYKYAFRNSDIICLSDLLTYDIVKVFNGTIHIVANGIPDIDHKLLVMSQENKNEEINTLFFSNLIMSKGILDFIDSLELLAEKGTKFQATIIGAAGTLSSNDLQKIIHNKNLDSKVTYVGPKYGSEKHHILAQSDVMVFPTKNDAFPGVVIEAMQFGLPVISTKEGAIPEIIDDGVTGYLVEKDSPEQIVEKLEILIKDVALRKSMGLAGRAKYEKKFKFQTFEDNMLKVFNTVLETLNN